LESNATWLWIEKRSGKLAGTPTNKDRGSYWVKVSVDDGNGGWDLLNYTLEVIDMNDPPIITTKDINTIYEDEFYSVDYSAIDIDGETNFKWGLITNATWLTINENTGVLYGTPQNEDVGLSFVNVTAIDIRNGTDSHNFTLEVINVNDPPEWVNVPIEPEVNEGDLFTFDIKATDFDKGDVLTYTISADKSKDITINTNTGLIEWTATTEGLSYPNYMLKVTVEASDGKYTIRTNFKIKVIRNNRPTVKLLYPEHGSTVSSSNTEFRWEGQDEEGESLTYDLYLSNDQEYVSELRETVRFLHHTSNTSVISTRLKPGSTYYWTVRPHDGRFYGECNDGVFSIEVNFPPTTNKIPLQRAMVNENFKFEIKANDENKDDLRHLVYSIVLAPDGMSIEPTTGVISWTPKADQVGKHNVTVQVSDGKDNTSAKFEIEVVEDGEKGSPIFNSFFIIITTTIILMVIILNINLAINEASKYKVLSLVFVPLYNKLHPENVMDNRTRGQIHGYIKKRPGENYNAIKKALELKNGILAHHLRILEKEEFVYSKRDGFYTRFYPKGMILPDSGGPKLNKVQKNLIELIRKQPGLTQRKIKSIIGKSQQVVSYNLNRLVRNNIIIVWQHDWSNKYFINYGDQPTKYPGQTQASSKGYSQPQSQPEQGRDKSELPAMKGTEPSDSHELLPISEDIQNDEKMDHFSGLNHNGRNRI
jgi:predicted transcriptional regulator